MYPFYEWALLGSAQRSVKRLGADVLVQASTEANARRERHVCGMVYLITWPFPRFRDASR